MEVKLRMFIWKMLAITTIGIFAYDYYSMENSLPAEENTSQEKTTMPDTPKGKLVTKNTVFTTVNAPTTWPPAFNQSFPELQLKNEDGETFSLHNLLKKSKASVLIIEPIALTCSGCAAFAGAHNKGQFRGTIPQAGLKSFEEYFKTYAGRPMNNRQVALVHLLLYSSNLTNPSMKDAQDWATHFHPGMKNYFVIAAQTEYQNKTSKNLIPGFYLLNKNLQILSDSTGHHPKHNLYTHLLPLAGTLFNPESSLASLESNTLPVDLGMSVKSAYQAIPHRQKSFDYTDAPQMNDEQKEFFKSYFEIVDNAVVARVAHLIAYNKGDMRLDANVAYSKLISDAEELPAVGLDLYKNEFIKVLEEHRDFFVEWKNGRSPSSASTLGSNPKVQSSSGRLHSIYGWLMSQFAKESEGNRDAFFQHLCALDFI